MITLKTLVFLWLLWSEYVLVMGLYRAKLDGRLSKPAKILGSPHLVIGWTMDFLANMIPFTFIMVELPRELLVTSRLKRHLLAGKKDFRWRIAHAICDKLLDMFDPNGSHCVRPPKTKSEEGES